ncbi:MAG: thiamine-phosphate diphosphorylase [Acidobacteria bacterium SCN 69-37]|nr:MAG: thiamine-phosphate diphosphorylase [Acidobacteria bacterium SCN 69-37]
MSLVLPAFYPILDIDVARARALRPLDVLTAWLDAGVTLVQLRAKSLDAADLLALADQCSQATRAAGARLIVNDRVDVAVLSGADGVHVGQDDLPPAAVRRLLPAPALVGWSTHTPAQLEAAAAMPIDYVAIGPVFETRSKAQPDPVVGLEGVRQAVALAAGRPVVAIGGITLDRVSDVLAAGASSMAVIGDVLHAEAGPRARAFLAAARQVGSTKSEVRSQKFEFSRRSK